MRFEGLLVIKSKKGKYCFDSAIPVKCIRLFGGRKIGICMVRYSNDKWDLVDCETELAKGIVDQLKSEGAQ